MSDIKSLINRRVTIRENDFVEVPLHGHIEFIGLEGETMLIALDASIVISGTRYDRIIASPRLERDNLRTLQDTGVIGCGITWIPQSKYDPNLPLDLGWWRGGATAISDIILN